MTIQAESIYVNQSKLRQILILNVDLTTATTAWIKYKKPAGTVGHWVATVLTTNMTIIVNGVSIVLTPSMGVIYYDVISTEIDEAGNWTLWPFITFSDTRSAPGASTTMLVLAEPGLETP